MGLLRSAASAAARAPRTVLATTVMPVKTAASAPAAAASLAKTAVSLPAKAVRALPIAPSGTRIADLVGKQRRRRIWARNGRAYIEVRGLHSRADQRVHEALKDAVHRLEGVNWAEVNAVTGEVLVAFDEDTVTTDQLAETIADVEEAHHGSDDPFPDYAHPADRGPIVAEAVALAADWMAFGFAVTGRVMRLARLPRGSRVVLAIFDGQPRLRRELETRLGRYGADLVLAIGNAAMFGLTQEPEALAIDGIYRMILLSELRARYAVWCRREAELSSAGLPQSPPERTARPGVLPAGPIEKYTDQAAIGSLLGAGGMLALTRDPGTAAEVLLAGIPRPAMLGRDGYAAMLSRSLSRYDVLPLRGSAYRMLDRITAIVVDSAVLCGAGMQICEASSPAAWRLAAQLLEIDPELQERPDSQGRRLVRLDPFEAPTCPAGVRLQVVEGDGTVIGKVTAACQVDPLADAVLAAARESGARLLLTEHAATAELLPLVDEAIPAGPESHAETVRRLQREGHGVLVMTSEDHSAAVAADVSIGVLRPDCPACWGADVICGPDLENAWRLLTAVGLARKASAQAVRLALGGSSLAALLVVTGRRRPSPLPLDLAPVYSAGLIALASGALTARRVLIRPLPEPTPHIAWHALDPDTALRKAQEIRRQLEAAEPAAKAPRRPRLPAPVGRLASAVTHELSDPLTPVLVLGAAASAVVGSGVDAALVGGVMTGNALISGIQRMRAEQALRRLLIGQRIPARRVRGDRVELVSSAELKIGDIIEIGPSEVVPADARLIEVDNLEVDESRLTGESVPVTKSAEPCPAAELAERTCMIFEDTTVLAGHARAVVVATGAATQAGRAAALAGPPAAPRGVQAQLNELTQIALPATGFSGALVSALAFVRGVSIRDAISSGVSLAIAAVPEGLTLVATVAQLAAARRLSRRGVLARSSRTLGTLGSVDTLCFDKTGTLTLGTLQVAKLSGLTKETDPEHPLGRRLLTAAARTCPPGDDLQHATDRAIVAAARSHLGEDPDWRLVDEIPFEASRGYSGAAGFDRGRPCVAVKGAPEVVLPRCTRVVSGATTRPMTDERMSAARATVRRLAEAGLRVLAVAEARPEAAELADAEKLIEIADLVLIGFIGIADAPRPEAAPAIRRLTEAGIRVVMITGDHPTTAQAIASALGIPNADRVLTGAQLERLSERERMEQIAQTSVFARVSPEHKVRIVQTLQRAGHVVAMTGDGSNDAAAIRLADVGIGISAGDSRAAPLAADLIVPGADLPGIVEALLEGRALWDSVRNAVSILVGGNAGEVAFTVYGTAVGGRAPLSTRQLLLVNTLTDMMPALAVALAPPGGAAGRIRLRLPGPLSDPLAQTIVLRGAVTAVGSVLAWHAGRVTGRGRRASTMGLAALVTTQLAQTLQSGRHSPTVIATCAASMAVLVAVIETPGLSQFFGCTPLGPIAWTLVLASATGAVGGAALAARAPRLRAIGAEPPRALPARGEDPTPDAANDPTSDAAARAPGRPETRA